VSLQLAGLLVAHALAHSPAPLSPPATVEPHREIQVDRSGDPLPPHALVRLGTYRFQQANGVTAAAWSPDGRILAASGFDGEVVLWDVSSGLALRRFSGWAARTHALAFSPDGKWLALCGNVFQVWELASGKEAIYYSFPARQPILAFSPNGKYVAAIDREDRLRLWELGPGFPTSFYEGAPRGLKALAVREYNDLRLFAARDEIRTVSSYPEELESVPVIEARIAVQGAAFSADARTLALSIDAALRLYDAGSGKEVRRVDTGRNIVGAPVFSADGKRAAMVHDDNTASVWNLKTGKECMHLDGAGVLSFVALSPDGKTLAVVAGRTNALQLWEVSTGRRFPTVPTHTSAVDSVALSPDGKYAATAARRGDPTARLWDTTTGKLVREFRGSDGGVTSVAFSPDGRLLLTAHQGDQDGVRLWDVRTGDRVRAFAEGDAVAQAVLTPDGTGVLAAVVGEKNWRPLTTVHLWNRETGAESLNLSRDGAPARVGIAPDGRYLFVAGNGLGRWDTQTGRERPWKPATPRELCHAVYSPDGRWLALSNDRHQTEIWETLAPRWPVLSLEGDCPAFSPDGRYVALAVQNDIHLVDLSGAGPTLKRNGHSGAVRALTFSADGKRLLSGSADATALVWDVSELMSQPLVWPEALTAQTIETAWTNLLARDAHVANRAAWVLSAAGEPTVAMLKTKLAACSETQHNLIKRLVAELDDEDFETRERASRELASQIDEARALLETTRDKKPSAEVRRRVDELLTGEIDGVPSESTRSLRAVAVLESATKEIGYRGGGCGVDATSAGDAATTRTTRDKGGEIEVLAHRFHFRRVELFCSAGLPEI
jgi:WD40 repeat protein